MNSESAVQTLHEELMRRITDEFKTLRAVSDEIKPGSYFDDLQRRINQKYSEVIAHIEENNRKTGEMERLLKEMSETYENVITMINQIYWV